MSEIIVSVDSLAKAKRAADAMAALTTCPDFPQGFRDRMAECVEEFNYAIEQSVSEADPDRLLAQIKTAVAEAKRLNAAKQASAPKPRAVGLC